VYNDDADFLISPRNQQLGRRSAKIYPHLLTNRSFIILEGEQRDPYPVSVTNRNRGFSTLSNLGFRAKKPGVSPAF
jgi:hypothetical protein